MQSFMEFVKNRPLRTFEKDEVILSQASDASVIYAIQSGFVKVYSISSDGSEQFVWLSGRLDVVPTELLFSRRGQLQYFYSAFDKVHAYEIDKPSFLDFAYNDPETMTGIARSMSQHYDDLLARVSAVEQPTVRDKLIRTLYHIAQRFSAEEVVSLHGIGLNLTHGDIASLIGSTRETAAVELKKLKDEKYIDYSRSELTINVYRMEELL